MPSFGSPLQAPQPPPTIPQQMPFPPQQPPPVANRQGPAGSFGGSRGPRATWRSDANNMMTDEQYAVWKAERDRIRQAANEGAARQNAEAAAWNARAEQ